MRSIARTASIVGGAILLVAKLAAGPNQDLSRLLMMSSLEVEASRTNEVVAQLEALSHAPTVDPMLAEQGRFRAAVLRLNRTTTNEEKLLALWDSTRDSEQKTFLRQELLNHSAANLRSLVRTKDASSSAMAADVALLLRLAFTEGELSRGMDTTQFLVGVLVEANRNMALQLLAQLKEDDRFWKIDNVSMAYVWAELKRNHSQLEFGDLLLVLKHFPIHAHLFPVVFDPNSAFPAMMPEQLETLLAVWDGSFEAELGAFGAEGRAALLIAHKSLQDRVRETAKSNGLTIEAFSATMLSSDISELTAVLPAGFYPSRNPFGLAGDGLAQEIAWIVIIDQSLVAYSHALAGELAQHQMAKNDVGDPGGADGTRLVTIANACRELEQGYASLDRFLAPDRSDRFSREYVQLEEVVTRCGQFLKDTGR